MLNNLPPEIIAAISTGITSLIALVIRWIETRIFRAKISGHAEKANELQAQVDELRKRLGSSL